MKFTKNLDHYHVSLTVIFILALVSPDAVIVPIGGGGLIAGIAAYFKQNPLTSATTNVIGVQPVNDAAMHASIEAGHIVDIVGLDTLSDATAGGIEREDNITFELTKRCVQRSILCLTLTCIIQIRRVHLVGRGRGHCEGDLLDVGKTQQSYRGFCWVQRCSLVQGT